MDSSRRAARAAAFLVLALLPASFAHANPARHFQIEAYRGHAGESRLFSYRLICAPATSAADVALLTECVRTTLTAQGMFEAPAGIAPDLQITVTFRIEERVESASPFSRRFRPVTHRMRTIEVRTSESDGAIQRTRHEVALPVDDGYVARSSEPRTVTVFAKRLEIAARVVNTSRELWRVQVSNKDPNGDAHSYARLMVAAALDHIATTAVGRKDVVVTTDDPQGRFADASR